MRTALVVFMLCACPAIAAAAIQGGSANDITPSEGLNPYLITFTPGNADGDHVAVIALDTADGATTIAGRVVTRDGEPKGETFTWSNPDVGIGRADAAIDATGQQGLAVWREPDPQNDTKSNLVVRPFDARTAKATAEPTTVMPILSFFDIEAFGDGYAIVYERAAQDDPEQVIQFLDAQGAPDGKARVLHTGGEYFFVSMYRSPSASRLAVMTRGPYGTSGIALDLFAPAGKSVRKRINTRDDFLVDIAHASGAAFLTLWQSEGGSLYLRRLNGAGKLGPRRTVAAKAGQAFAIAFHEDRGVVIHQTNKCNLEAIEVTRSGKTRGAPSKVAQDCGRRKLDSGIFLTAGDSKRFGLGYTASRRERDPALFAAGLRLGG